MLLVRPCRSTARLGELDEDADEEVGTDEIEERFVLGE